MNRSTYWMALALILGPTSLADSAPDIDQRFARLDADRNGDIQWSEAEAVRKKEFSEMDQDGDGVVMSDEFGGRAMPLSAFDADADGKLTLSEYVDKHKQMFQKFDTDASGSIDKEEFAKAQASVGNAAK